MVTRQFRHQINMMRRCEDPRTLLVIHEGANDIGGLLPIKVLRKNLINLIDLLSADLPDIQLVWSKMLPRLKLWFSDNTKAMEQCKQTCCYLCFENKGSYIRYPDITRDCVFFRNDGIHLLDIGNNIFINTVQGRLEKFLTEPNVHVFP